MEITTMGLYYKRGYIGMMQPKTLSLKAGAYHRSLRSLEYDNLLVSFVELLYTNPNIRHILYLEGQGDLVSRRITPISHRITPIFPITNPLTKSP